MGLAGRRAAISVGLASVVLAGCLGLARGDELADLRRNNDLLQQRIEQLAQVPFLTPKGAYFTYQPSRFPRSFIVPGTETAIRIGGALRTDFVYWFNGTGGATICVRTSVSGSITTTSIRGSSARPC